MADRIPDGITRSHVEAAIRDFDAGKAHQFGESTGYDLSFQGNRYPPKAIVGLAASYVTGDVLGPYDFKGGLKSKCFRVLEDLGFSIIVKVENPGPVGKATMEATANLSDAAGDFDPESIDQARERQIRAIALRRGQPKFRAALLRAYGSRCAITDCDVEEALEAAHIVPYQGNRTNHPQNGLLLRSDIHTLFDRGLIGLDPDTCSVVLHPKLRSGAYGPLHGRVVNWPKRRASRPSKEALGLHLQEILASWSSAEVG